MKKTLMLAAALLLAGSMQAKKTLGHEDFDSWEKLTNSAVSADGRWASFIVQPQEGDGTLTFYDTRRGRRIEIPRGYRPAFTADGKYAVALIKPFYSDTRKGKIAKKKGFDLPQDSLAIVDLATGKIEKAGRVISYKLGKDGGDWVAWQTSDTAYVKPKALKDKKAGRPLIIRNLKTGASKTVNWVGDYVFSKDGSKIAFNLKTMKKDTLSTPGVGIVMLPDTALHLIDRDKKFYGIPVFSEDGQRLAYTASDDTVATGTKKTQVFLTTLAGSSFEPREVALTVEAVKEGRLMPNQYTIPAFSHNGKRLVVRVAPFVAPDDTTLVSFETAGLDIWRWDAPYTPPQTNKNIERFRKQGVPVVVGIDDNTQVLVTDNPVNRVVTPDRWDGDWALVADNRNIVQRQWDYSYPVELLLKNVSSGEERKAGEFNNGTFELSPADRYILWFDGLRYLTYEISSGRTAVISEGVPYPLYDEDRNTPAKVKADYGVMGWTEGDARVLVYDRHDVWALDPVGKSAPVCITAGEGRKNNIRYRYERLDREERALRNGQTVVYSMFNYANMKNGLASSTFSLKPSSPRTDFFGEWEYIDLIKSKNAGVYTWKQGNFSTSPNIYVTTDIAGGKAVKASDTNPQMADYNWGTARLFEWTTYEGKPSKGILYLPEDFSPDKQYPMISYFYETYSSDLYHHFDMEPSWSWINFPFYTSRGYAIFVPDIEYTPGIPGENAYDYVCSGVEAVCKAYPNIDIKRVGIDGQSWGGYQTAYLVTRTDMFACAGSGAPVANMTSAFGGIRWESGDSRQGQYEQGQSRIGRNLWEAPELYIANSPVMHADRVKTPLLIMHNDADGAVPWYQGIEMFMALRRLQKPVWMLQYNNEAHNLRERRNRKDITRRLQQFFDHYLQGAPMPEWMKNGIQPLRKGQDFGFELTEE